MPPLSAIIAENVWWVCALIFLLLRSPHMLRARSEPVRANEQSTADWVLLRVGEFGFGVLPLVYILTDFPAFATYRFFPPFLILGSCVFLASFWVIWRAHRDLGRSFSGTLEIRDRHELVTGGIYAYVRHPMYLAFLLWGLAQAMLLPNWIAGFSALAAMTLLLAHRLPREEAMMIRTFGEGYRAYSRTTARFIPGVF